jgi:hypothetical protein
MLMIFCGFIIFALLAKRLVYDGVGMFKSEKGRI